MNQNNIKDIIFKKLIREGFQKEQIFSLIKISEKFSRFSDYLYYLYLMSGKKYDSDICKITNPLNMFLEEIISEYQIIPMTQSDLKKGVSLSNQEIYLIGVKGYGSNHNFYFDVDDNLYICKDNVLHDEYKSVFNICFNHQEKDIFDTELNKRIINQKFNKIFIFKLIDEDNVLIDNFNFIGISNFYSDTEQLTSFILQSESGLFEELEEFKNLNERKRLQSLNKLKQSLIEISLHNNISVKIVEAIESCDDHFTTLQVILHYLISNKQKLIINDLINKFPVLIKSPFSISKLIQNKTTLNEMQIATLCNSYDILLGNQIVSDYLNNIHICINNTEKNIGNDRLINFKFCKSFYGLWFDLSINKKIFNTLQEDTIIYIWRKQNNKFEFIDFYKVSQIKIEKDLRDQKQPVFVFRPITQIELLNNIIYTNKNIASNAYKNIFLEKLKNNINFENWSNQLENSNVIETKRENDKNNSLLHKYNWIINKCVVNCNNDLFDKYSNAFIDFDNKILNNTINCLSKNFYKLVENKVVEPWTIAFELTKMNYIDQEITNISFIDYYLNKDNKYLYLLSVLKK
ncbi:MAG: hypothetical protein ACRC4L_00960 [Mycoplasma sp.]